MFQNFTLMDMNVYQRSNAVIYHLEKYRDAANESGIMYNDKKLKIKWITKKPILSTR